ncbi:MAG: hypothetical protein WBD55_10265 [Dehalococcoidia bacterium]
MSDTANGSDISLQEEAGQLERTPIGDHIHNVVTAGLNAVPFVGGSLASLIDDYIPKRKEERIRDFLEKLAEEVDGVKDRLGAETSQYVRTDEFAYLLERAFRGAVEAYQEDKIRAYRAVLVNSLLPDAPDEDSKLFFLSLVESLTPLHFRIVRILRDPQGFDAETGNRVGPGDGISTSRLTIMRKLMPDYAEELLEATWRDLNVRGVVSTDSLRAMITDKGIDQMVGLLTPLGQQFTQFVTVRE